MSRLRPGCYDAVMLRTGKIKHLWLLQAATDFAALVAAYFTTLQFRFHSEWGVRLFGAVNQAPKLRETGVLGDELDLFYVSRAPQIIFQAFAILVILYALRDLYPGRRFIRKSPTAWNVVVANVMALAFFYAYFYLQRNVFHPRSFFAVVLALNIVYCVALRALMDRFLVWMRSRFGADVHHAILVGSNGEADFVSQFISEFHPHGIHVIAHREFDMSKPFEQQISDLERAAVDLNVDLIISAEKRLSVSQIMQLIALSDRIAIPIKVLSDELSVLPNQARLPVDLIHGTPLVHFDTPTTAVITLWRPRVLTTLASCVAMLILLPVLGLIALLIRLTSKGPAVFVQERIGVNRKPFMMYKFRTMHDRAEEMLAQVEEFRDTQGPLFKIRYDPRVTPLGRFLRRFSLDELPQLLNVVRGEMTIVGPRPLPRKDFEGYYEDWHYSRHGGMPGLTCLWQVSGRSDLDFHTMCILDVYYLRNRSWILDVKIILRTVWVVLFAKGAY